MPRTRYAAGKVNLIGLVLIAGVVAGIYALIMFSPAYVANLSVKEAIAAAYNQSGTRDDASLRIFIESQVNQRGVGTHQETDGFGVVQEVPGLGITDEQITIVRDDARKTILIQVDYVREVQLKPLQRITRLRFNPKHEGPINP